MSEAGAPVPIIVMPGEGIGPEIVGASVPILQALAERFDVEIAIEEFAVGEASATGDPLPADARAACDRAVKEKGAILFGSVADEPIGILRKDYDLFANLRPIRSLPSVADVSPLREPTLDLLVVRELVSGVYYGAAEEGEGAQGKWASQLMIYHQDEVERIARVAFDAAMKRRRHVTYVHKDNVIKGVFALWREVIEEVARDYPDVTWDDVLVDNMAMQLVLRPAKWDVLLCSNLFGDILSDLGAGLVGSLGLLPSASLAPSGFGLYEPVGGTAPDIAGQGIANPFAAISSVGMLFRYGLGRPEAEDLLAEVLAEVTKSVRTKDIHGEGQRLASTEEFAEEVLRELKLR